MPHDVQRHQNHGKPPRDKTATVGIEFANGSTAKHSYRVDQLRWNLTGDDWDISYFWRA